MNNLKNLSNTMGTLAEQMIQVLKILSKPKIGDDFVESLPF